MRRKAGGLLPLEVEILAAADELRRQGTLDFYGFAVAREMQDRVRAKLLTGYGTLYKSLIGLEKAGLLESRWEDPDVAEFERRPRRRLYRLTAAGDKALAVAGSMTQFAAPRLLRGTATA